MNLHTLSSVVREHLNGASRYFALMTLIALCSLSSNQWFIADAAAQEVNPKIYWSDADSGRLGDLKFRIANKDAPETGSLKQRGGAKCEAERELGYEAKAFMVGFTKGKIVRIAKEYGEDRYGRLVVDLTADGVDVGNAGVDAGHLRDWPHKKGRALTPKPDWCAP